MYKATTATHKLAKLNKRIKAVAGGTSASKTISILLLLIDYAQTHEGKLISVVSESFPHLKRGAIRDFINIMEEHKYFDESRWNKTDYTYTFPTRTKVEFFSADQPSKVRGPRRDVLFINEANNIPYETYTQLEVRTKETIWLDWNPESEFWFYTDVKNNEEVDFLTLTYKDNEALEPSIVKSIESKKGNARWWRVYGLGELGDAEGKVYKEWQIIDEIPHEARLIRYGLDFGYTNDPTAIVAIYSYNGGFILDEKTYRTGMKNREIADVLLNLPEAPIYADSAEPKSIDEIKEYGVDIYPAAKGAGSRSQGVQYIQDQRISVTENSINLLKEYRGYGFKKDREGKYTNTPEDGNDHLMDAIRYGIATKRDMEADFIDPNKNLSSLRNRLRGR